MLLNQIKERFQKATKGRSLEPFQGTHSLKTAA